MLQTSGGQKGMAKLRGNSTWKAVLPTTSQILAFSLSHGDYQKDELQYVHLSLLPPSPSVLHAHKQKSDTL